MTLIQSSLLGSTFLGATPFVPDNEGNALDSALLEANSVCWMAAAHGAIDTFQKTRGEACKKITRTAMAALIYFGTTALFTIPICAAKNLFLIHNSPKIAPFAVSILTVAFAKRIGKINSNLIIATVLFGGLFHQFPSFLSTGLSMEMCRGALKTAFAYFFVTKVTLNFLSR